ncbi:YusG family protein [Litchfieldia alkalitelluris]|uniref:YusG family protein n=1 Tax=Litchfieldia alkalitelluris TaxID=304268 RepID=UPI0009960D78|nr:YusG family protein [Litchfieldia alkalitelluris]
MVLEKRRLDITDRVVGKIGQNQVDLFLENEPIGRMVTTRQGNEYELNNGFEEEESKIYQFVDITTGPDQKYVDCDDENGWC